MKIRPIMAVAALALALIASGCVTTGEQQRLDYAAGLHQNAPERFKVSWHQYLRQTQGQWGILALDKEGRAAGWITCQSGCNLLRTGAHNSTKNLWLANAIRHCEKVVRENNPGARADCDVYAIKDEIVWEHPLPWASSRTSTRHDREKRDPIAFTPEARGELAE